MFIYKITIYIIAYSILNQKKDVLKKWYYIV